GIDQVRDQVGAALVLVDYLGPRGLDAFILLHHAVVAAPREAKHRRGHDRTDPRTHRTSPCMSAPAPCRGAGIVTRSAWGRRSRPRWGRRGQKKGLESLMMCLPNRTDRSSTAPRPGDVSMHAEVAPMKRLCLAAAVLAFVAGTSRADDSVSPC